MNAEVSLHLVLQAWIASEGTPLQAKLRRVIGKAAGGIVSSPFKKGWRALEALERSPAGALTDFEIGDEDRDVAAVATSQMPTTAARPGRENPPSEVRVFSRWSLVDAGFMSVTPESATYHAQWAARDPAAPAPVVELRPAARASYAKSLQALSSLEPRAVAAIGNHVGIALTGIGDPPEQSKASSWSCALINPQVDGPRATTLLRGLKVTYPGGPAPILVELTSPEAVLQTSAAASCGGWINLVSGSFDAVFPAPDLSEEGSGVPAWVRTEVASLDYLKIQSPAWVELPERVALECVARFRWFTIDDKPAMIRALSELAITREAAV